MRKLAIAIAAASVIYGCGSSKKAVTAEKTVMETKIDLIGVVDDKVAVEIDPGSFNEATVSFYIPKTVPGTYSTDDYGQYIADFKALDYQGNPLPVTKPDVNTWQISNAPNLDKVVYWVNDTYDTESQTKNPVFSPAGTNIDKGVDFMLNLHGFVGYFGGLKEVPYRITIKKPADLKSTTSLARSDSGPGSDAEVFTASRYFEVIDNPILYAKSDPVSFAINDIVVTLSMYSPNGLYTANDLKDRMAGMMTAQKNFLGDINTTKKYNILLYLSKMDGHDANGFGALEHHTSTTVVFPEAMPKDRLEQGMVDVVSHEFFHIVTPLSVHSKEIQFFDFNDPKMSEHLWMYEGTTEYFANLFQIQQGLIDETEFYKRIMDKISNSRGYDDTMSFTKMSKNILEEPYKKNYANVYEKGALINMCLDIILREHSNGEHGVLWMMKELSKKYGVDTPFNDADLINEIVAMTYPEVRTFFDKHVIGGEPIDYGLYLGRVGLALVDGQKQTGYFLDGEIPFIDVDPANDNAIFIRSIPLHSSFTALGIQGGDVIRKINGQEINLAAIRPIIGQSFGWTPDTDIEIVVDRDGQELILTGKVGTPVLDVQTIMPMNDATEGQKTLREAWEKN